MGRLAGLLEAAKLDEVKKHAPEARDSQQKEQLVISEAQRLQKIQTDRIKEWNSHRTIGI